MNMKFLRLLIQIALITFIFFPLMHQKGDETLILTGIEAIIKGDYLIIGNIVIALIFLGVIIHFVGIVMEFASKKRADAWLEGMNIMVNITTILSFLMVTFLGTFLAWLGYIYIGLLILSTYLRYVDQKKSEHK
jgi:heme/copper-type cytochrome/quinol oxidase subunit 2